MTHRLYVKLCTNQYRINMGINLGQANNILQINIQEVICGAVHLQFNNEKKYLFFSLKT